MASIFDSLLRDPVLTKCNYATLSHLPPHLEERSYPAGETMYRAGEPTDGLYPLTSGEVTLKTPDEKKHTLSCPRFGEESATDADTYLADAIALTPVIEARFGLKPLGVRDAQAHSLIGAFDFK